jgi:hypothetical protein
MSKTRIIVIAVIAVTLSTAVFMLPRALPFVFDRSIKDAVFQDCMTLEAMLPVNSKDDIIKATDLCAKKNKININDVSFQSVPDNQRSIIAIVDYSVPLSSSTKFKRRIEKKFMIEK